MQKNSPTVIDLFCGAGGMSLGFLHAGYNVVGGIDVEHFNVETHHTNFPTSQSIQADIRLLNGDTIRERFSFYQNLDVLVGGPPCQGFSTGGHQDISDERNSLIFDFARITKQLRPNYFVMENVSGLLSKKYQLTLNNFIRQLTRAGYSVLNPVKTLNAANYGVPQRRLRTFIIGHLKGVSAAMLPEPRTEGSYTTVKDAIEDLLVLENHDYLYNNDIFTGKLPKPSNRYALSLSKPKLGLRTPSKTKFLTGCLRTIHSPDVICRFQNTPPGKVEKTSRYIRLHLESVCSTLRAGTGPERGSYTAPRPIHPVFPRCITTREAARLHSFPDWFKFHGTRWHDFRQIGNSVPPFLAQAVANSIRESIG